MAAADVQLDLKKRARRRLVGAAALALIAAAVLPMVMDHEPGQAVQDIEIRIPNPEQEALTPRTAPAPGEVPPVEAERAPSKTVPAPPAAAEPEAPAMPQASEAAPATEPAKTTEPPAPAKAVEPPAENAAKAQWVVQLGAFSDAANVDRIRTRVKAQGYNVFTEKLPGAGGTRTRVRAGPFASREAAEQAKAKLALAGLQGIVAER